jgi:trehalose-phosphatase
MGRKYYYDAHPPAHPPAIRDRGGIAVNKPAYLFSRESGAWARIGRRLRSAPGIALFLDYDGTLTPIRRVPSAAVLSPEATDILRRIARLRGTSVTLVTGRALTDIQKLIPIEAICIAANHGFHLLQDGSEWIHPDAIRFIRDLNHLQTLLRNSMEEFPRAAVENKQFTLSVHYRNVTAQKVKPLLALVKKTVRSYDPSLVLTRGKKVLEVRPSVVWGKGKAVLKILKTLGRSGRPLPVFIGDDVTDEDVFHALRTKGITVRVGRSRETAAKYFVKDVDEVLQLLRTLIALRTSGSARQRARGR